MHRLDAQLIELDEQMASSSSDSTFSEIKNREKTLAPLYTQIAHEFADLHDRAGRMKAKGCITEVLEWRTAREYFYWRIRRRQVGGLDIQHPVTNHNHNYNPNPCKLTCTRTRTYTHDTHALTLLHIHTRPHHYPLIFTSNRRRRPSRIVWSLLPTDT